MLKKKSAVPFLLSPEAVVAAPAGLPIHESRRCPKCSGTFRAAAREAPCPRCGGPSVPATERPLPESPAPLAVPEILLDEPLRQLLARAATLPAEIRDSEKRLAALEAERERSAEAFAELRVRRSVGLVSEKAVTAASNSLEALDAQIAEIENSLDHAVRTSRVIGEAVRARIAERRAALVPKLLAEAKRLADAAAPHVDALQRLAEEGNQIAGEFAPAFEEPSVGLGTMVRDPRAGTALGVLGFLARRRAPRPRTQVSIADLLSKFQPIAARLEQ